MKRLVTDAEYIEARIQRTNGCWPWAGPVQSNGYGLANLRDGGVLRRVGAHRAVYELLVGPIPADRTLDHGCHNKDLSCAGGDSCRHRRCVNPSHLEPVSRGENSRRGRGTPAVNLSKSICLRGHEYDHVDSRGWRKCSACIELNSVARRRRAGVRERSDTHCFQGHPYSPENTRIYRDGQRCRTCAREGQRARRARQSADPAVEPVLIGGERFVLLTPDGFYAEAVGT